MCEETASITDGPFTLSRTLPVIVLERIPDPPVLHPCLHEACSDGIDHIYVRRPGGVVGQAKKLLHDATIHHEIT